MESNYAAAFFAYMQSKGAYTLTDVTEPLILSYFYDREKQLRGYTCQKVLLEYYVLLKVYFGKKNVNIFAI